VIHDTDHFTLADGRTVAQIMDSVYFLLPLILQHPCGGVIRILDGVAFCCRFQFLEGRASVTDKRQRGVLVGIELGGVDVDESHVGVLKGRLGSSGEIAVPGSNPNHEIGFASADVGSGRAGNSDGPKILRMVITQGTLSRLGFYDRDPRLCGKP
jgi:hypothetical protein